MTLIQYVKSVPGVVEHHLCNYLFILESTVCFIVPNGLIITLIGDCKMTKHRRQSTLKWHRCMVRCDYLHTARPLSRHNLNCSIHNHSRKSSKGGAIIRSSVRTHYARACFWSKGINLDSLDFLQDANLGQMNTDLGLSC